MLLTGNRIPMFVLKVLVDLYGAYPSCSLIFDLLRYWCFSIRIIILTAGGRAICPLDLLVLPIECREDLGG
ncbi:hypothetical protein C447_01275 [Halococcus hamelinensis 100A6]|uniref:Uncharacterized protein n=1 Tax=Halococcus hamelinensis 100A6 TaxID=1132509 RepID=M0M7V4_9EURY|nr:hypothetical protein C447_01275 [Halococcus hamelinensis 100A6]